MKIKDTTILLVEKYKKNFAAVGLLLLILSTLLLAVHQISGTTSNAPLIIALLFIIIGVMAIIANLKQDSKY